MLLISKPLGRRQVGIPRYKSEFVEVDIMSIARNFDDFKEEIELAFIQNACVEIELYSQKGEKEVKFQQNIMVFQVSRILYCLKEKKYKMLLYMDV